MTASETAAATLVVRRTIAATAEELFDAWLDPAALRIWMRPGDIRSTTAQLDARVGGRYELVMQGDENTYPHNGEYRVIDRPRQLVFTWSSPGTGNRPTLVTVDFLAASGQTEVVITHELLPATALDAHDRGWTSGLQQLARFAGGATARNVRNGEPQGRHTGPCDVDGTGTRCDAARPSPAAV